MSLPTASSAVSQEAGPNVRPGLRTFFILWLGQVVSLVGSGLTRFALGVWVYQLTGSVTQFALISVFAVLPEIVASPFAGVIVDRRSRRLVMLLSDLSAALGTVAVLVLFSLDRLEIWHLYLALGWGSLSAAFQFPAYSAAVTLLVPQKQLGRAAGMSEFAQAGTHILSPLLGGVLLATMGVHGVLSLDLVTFVFAIATLLWIRIPSPRKQSVPQGEVVSFANDLRAAWRYLFARPGLLGLLLYFSAMNLLVALVTVLATPLLLSVTTVENMGFSLGVAAGSMLLGSFTLGIWGGPKRRIYGVLGAGFLLGPSLILAGLQPSVWWITAGLFLFNFQLPLANGCSQAIWQSKVAAEFQGRVFALRRMFARLSIPLGFFLAGPLADRFFEPLLAAGGPMVASLGGILGVGPGRGIGLLYVVAGILAMLFTAGAFFSPRLSRIETELPDIVPDTAVPETTGKNPPSKQPEKEKT